MSEHGRQRDIDGLTLAVDGLGLGWHWEGRRDDWAGWCDASALVGA